MKFLKQSLRYCPCVQKHIKLGHTGTINPYQADFSTPDYKFHANATTSLLGLAISGGWGEGTHT